MGEQGTSSRASANELPSDSLLIRTAAEIMRIVPRLEEVWQGYWQPDQAIILFVRDSVALLVSTSAPPPGFAPVADAQVPKELRGRSYMVRGALPNLATGFDTDYPAGAARAVAVEVRPVDPATEAIELLFHEAFHAYQITHFKKVAGDGQFVSPASLSDPAFAAMAEVERKMLLAAISAPTDSLTVLLRAYLSVRWARMQSVTDGVRAVESALERSEGSADFVGHHAASLTSTAGNSYLSDQITARLAADANATVGGDVERLIRWRVYGTGSAIALLLDRMKVAWRARLEQGRTFDELLSGAVQFDSSRTSALLQPALEKYGFADVLARVGADTSAHAAMTFESFNKLAPFRIVMELVAPIVAGKMQSTGGMQGAFEMLDPLAVAIPLADVFEWKATTASLVVRHLPLLQDMRKSFPTDSMAMASATSARIRFVVPVASLPSTLEGKRLTSSDQRFDRIRLDHNGLTLSIDAPATARVVGSELIIRQGGSEVGGFPLRGNDETMVVLSKFLAPSLRALSNYSEPGQ